MWQYNKAKFLQIRPKSYQKNIDMSMLLEDISKLIGPALQIVKKLPICRMQSSNLTKFGIHRQPDSLRIRTKLGQILPNSGTITVKPLQLHSYMINQMGMCKC